MGTGTLLFKRVPRASSAGRIQWRFLATVALALLALPTLLPMPASAAVTISSFTAQAKAPQIQVDWKTATEINNAGFNLLRSTTQSGTYAKIAGLIPAKNPGSILGATYSYSDTAVTPGQTFYYKLVSVESSGGTQQFGPVSAAIPAQATATAPPPTKTLAPTAAPSATSTPIPSATALNPAPTSAPSATILVASSPTRAPKSSQPRASSTPDAGAAGVNPQSPTPGMTLVALGIKQSTPEPDSDNVETDTSAAEDSSASQSYYFDRLIISGVFLASFLFVMGTLILGTLAVYFFLRANLQ